MGIIPLFHHEREGKELSLKESKAISKAVKRELMKRGYDESLVRTDEWFGLNRWNIAMWSGLHVDMYLFAELEKGKTKLLHESLKYGTGIEYV